MSLTEKLGFGCVSLTTLPREREAIQLLETAFDNGIRLFDTAPVYGGGYSEKIVGNFLAGKRHKISITTKFGLQPKDRLNVPAWLALPMNYLKKNYKKNNTADSSFSASQPSANINAYRKIDKPEIEHSFYKSLQSLKTDYIDNYLLHEGLPSFLTDEAIDFIIKLKEDGKVLRIGIAGGFGNLMNEKDFSEWHILQYENGFFYPSDTLLTKFPASLHIYHSVLKGIKSLQIKNTASGELAALLLLKGLKTNLDGKVLFSTTSRQNILQNINNIQKYKDLPLEEIKYMINNALH